MVLKRMLPTTITLAVGIITLASYFLPSLAYIRGYWIELAVIIAAFAMLVGFINLLSVHSGRLAGRQHSWFFSFVTIVAAVGVLVVSILDALSAEHPHPAQALVGSHIQAIYTYVLYPLQSSFAALLAFLLALAAFRTLRLRRGLNALFFLAAAIIVLLAQAIPSIPELADLRNWLVNVLATAGLRGVLLGIGLATIATMVRVLVMIDRPASE
ncbi:MAG: hypothetical protein JW850_21550 [Thermoflexales bacterium]|nr:hypothetical protein [Thermoflexales bacterium]